MLVAWGSSTLGSLGRCQLAICCFVACGDGQTLSASGNSSHSCQGNRSRSACQDVNTLEWFNGWTPGQFSELVLDTLLLVVYLCFELGRWSSDFVAVVVGTA